MQRTTYATVIVIAMLGAVTPAQERKAPGRHGQTSARDEMTKQCVEHCRTAADQGGDQAGDKQPMGVYGHDGHAEHERCAGGQERVGDAGHAGNERYTRNGVWGAGQLGAGGDAAQPTTRWARVFTPLLARALLDELCRALVEPRLILWRTDVIRLAFKRGLRCRPRIDLLTTRAFELADGCRHSRIVAADELARGSMNRDGEHVELATIRAQIS